MKYRIAVCDDEEYCRSGIAEAVRENGFFECEVSAFSSAQQLINDMNINHNIPDILIMDVQLKDIDGIQAVKEIQSKHRLMKIIYISGNYFNSERIFDTQPSGFLIKPIEKRKLIETLLKTIDKIASDKSDVVTFSCGEKSQRYFAKEVPYIESSGRKIIIHGHNKTNGEMIGKLDDLRISSEDFFRIHKSFIVNFGFVEKLDCGFACLCGDIKLPISRTRAKEVGEAFAKYLGGLV